MKKALYGCIQSAVLWYNELASTLKATDFVQNPYDICSFTRVRDGLTDRILEYRSGSMYWDSTFWDLFIFVINYLKFVNPGIFLYN
jgi:hypothetical protein